MLLVIESGAIYSATLTTLIILYKVRSWFQYVLVDAVCSIHEFLMPLAYISHLLVQISPIVVSTSSVFNEYRWVLMCLSIGSCVLHDHHSNWPWHYDTRWGDKLRI